jgi:Sulfotransferase family
MMSDRRREAGACDSANPSAIRVPNFFIVGAPKAGTTSLYHYLAQHPEIYMSPLKEPTYFSLELRPEGFEASAQSEVRRSIEEVRRYVHGPMQERRSNGIICEWDDYLRLFAGATDERAIGEASVSYLWSKTAAAGIAAKFPQAKIVMILRAPQERAFSQYLERVTDGSLTQSFRDYVRACLRDSGEYLSVYRPFLEIGFYAEQVQRYLDRFPRRQIGIWIYEETKARPQEFMRELLEFLEVDNTFVPDTSKRHLEPRVPRLLTPNRLLRRARLLWISQRFLPATVKSALKDKLYRPAGSVTMGAEDKALMLDFYRNDILRLETILGRDLSLWLV